MDLIPTSVDRGQRSSSFFTGTYSHPESENDLSHDRTLAYSLGLSSCHMYAGPDSTVEFS